MATYEASVTASFAARHSVRMPDGNMEQPHQHDWQVTAAFRADRLDANGFVIDFLRAREALDEVASELAGADLNDITNCPAGASAERVAEYIARSLHCKVGREPYCVSVGESPGCAAAFYPGSAAT